MSALFILLFFDDLVSHRLVATARWVLNLYVIDNIDDRRGQWSLML